MTAHRYVSYSTSNKTSACLGAYKKLVKLRFSFGWVDIKANDALTHFLIVDAQPNNVHYRKPDLRKSSAVNQMSSKLKFRYLAAAHRIRWAGKLRTLRKSQLLRKGKPRIYIWAITNTDIATGIATSVYQVQQNSVFCVSHGNNTLTRSVERFQIYYLYPLPLNQEY